MSRELPNELEERRVIRLLAAAAHAVPPLHDVEAETFSRLAVARQGAPRPFRRFAPRRPPLLAAAAAASVLAVVLPMRQHEPQRPTRPAGGAAPIVSFPEGSALSLLLARPSERGA